MVSFFLEDINFRFNRKYLTKKWLKSVIDREKRKPGDINIIFCSDSYILEINRKYLSHNYYTDIITFDYCEGDLISGDLFISIDTVKANASEYGSSFNDELDRVLVHGVLHLVGYDDHTDKDTAVMRSKENYYLDSRPLA